MITVDNLTLRYGQETALRDVSFSIKQGESVSIAGASGCGKTSLLYTIADIVTPESGTVSISNNLKSIGLLFQKDLLLPWKTILQNILLGLNRSIENKEKAYSLLRQFRIEEHAGKYPQQLSEGQKQRAALARALIREPDLLLLDEPTSALDEISKELLQDLLKQTAEEFGLTMIIVTHSIEEAVFLGNRIFIMDKAGIYKSLDNPAFPIAKAREDQSFFKTCCEVRSLLQEVNAYE